MSDENQSTSSQLGVTIQAPITVTEPSQPAPQTTPTLDPTDEQRIGWMEDWKKKVQSDIDEYAAEKEKEMVEWRRQKEMYDGWLNKRMKTIKKFDKLMNERKKVMLQIDREIATINKKIQSKQGEQVQ
jgi:glutaredoxin 2